MLESRFQKSVIEKEPLTLSIKYYDDPIGIAPPKLSKARVAISTSDIKDLLPEEWFGDEVIQVYLSLVLESYPDFQVLSSHMIDSM